MRRNKPPHRASGKVKGATHKRVVTLVHHRIHDLSPTGLARIIAAKLAKQTEDT